MTQRNPRMQRPPGLIWAGLALLLLGVMQGTPSAFTGEAVQTLCMVAGQLLLLGTMLHEAWRFQQVKPWVLLTLLGVLLVGVGLQLWALSDAWQAERILRRIAE